MTTEEIPVALFMYTDDLTLYFITLILIKQCLRFNYQNGMKGSYIFQFDR